MTRRSEPPWAIDALIRDPAARLFGSTAVVVLRALEDAHAPASVTELAMRTHLTRHRVRRTCRRLRQLGVVAAERRRYALNRSDLLYPAVIAALDSRRRVPEVLGELAASLVTPEVSVALVVRRCRRSRRLTVVLGHGRRVKGNLRAVGETLATSLSTATGQPVDVRVVEVATLAVATSRTRNRLWRSLTVYGPDLAEAILDQAVGRGQS